MNLSLYRCRFMVQAVQAFDFPVVPCTIERLHTTVGKEQFNPDKEER